MDGGVFIVVFMVVSILVGVDFAVLQLLRDDLWDDTISLC